MTRVIFVARDGTRLSVDADNGSSLMKAAIGNDVPGIEAECGGACLCATCHVYIDEDWVDRVEAPDEIECEVIEIASNLRPNSRLSCQIQLNARLDGLVVHIPERQG